MCDFQMPAANVVMVSPDLLTVAKEMRAVLASHLVPGFIQSNVLKDEQVIDTFYPHATIRINYYNTPVKVRCIRSVFVVLYMY